ncbi:hypothetical protein BDZ45DRAFT_682522 [Acephala macrosclerotiorum]|nr:hypothetical protein BDZ45DRAFT_682522 [Acephala macrosclerotiorum]
MATKTPPPMDSHESRDEVEEIIRYDSTIENMITVLGNDWTNSIHTAPSAMATFTKCSVIGASQSAARVSIENEELQKLSKFPGLSANMLHCSQLGLNTFCKAHSEMETIANWALLVSKRGGSVNQIIKYISKPQSESTKKFIKIYVGSLDKASGICGRATDEMKQCCEEWNIFLQLLHKAVTTSKDGVNIKEFATKDESNRQKDKIEVASAREHRAKAIVDKEEANLQNIREWHESISRSLGTELERSTGLYAIGVAGISGLHSLYAEHKMSKARERYEAMIRMREAADLERKALEADLKKLSDQNTSLGEVKNIIGRAIEQLSNLQHQIIQLLTLFQSVSKKVKELVEHHNVLFIEHTEDCASLDKDSSGDIEDLCNTAAEVRKEFANIHVIAAVYAKVSSVTIMPGFSKLNEFLKSVDMSDSLEQQSNYDKSATALEEIDNWRDEAIEKVNCTIKEVRWSAGLMGA